MKQKILTVICTIMIFLPWTILPLREHPWALESPAAEIIISCYAAFLIFCGIFAILAYTIGNTRNMLMKVCLVIHCIYGVGGLAAFAMMLLQKT